MTVVPVLLKIFPTTLSTSKTWFGPAATCVSGGSQSQLSLTPNPMKLASTVGVVVSASESIGAASGSIAPAAIAAFMLRYAIGSRLRRGLERGRIATDGAARFIGSLNA